MAEVLIRRSKDPEAVKALLREMAKPRQRQVTIYDGLDEPVRPRPPAVLRPKVTIYEGPVRWGPRLVAVNGKLIE
jgi:hypothetical protein